MSSYPPCILYVSVQTCFRHGYAGIYHMLNLSLIWFMAAPLLEFSGTCRIHHVSYTCQCRHVSDMDMQASITCSCNKRFGLAEPIWCSNFNVAQNESSQMGQIQVKSWVNQVSYVVLFHTLRLTPWVGLDPNQGQIFVWIKLEADQFRRNQVVSEGCSWW